MFWLFCNKWKMAGWKIMRRVSKTDLHKEVRPENPAHFR
ncbi:hypothetical protein STCF374_0076 [Salmonella phage ST-374]|uniref:Uncharacterized protein n=1 Tax=Salmonella phage ST-374 TaxID=1897741 RepID=A0A678PBE8_9CAUD|nr:hypothetical protein STCF374_0076 [Salmonella phage ST-374]